MLVALSFHKPVGGMPVNLRVNAPTGQHAKAWGNAPRGLARPISEPQRGDRDEAEIVINLRRGISRPLGAA